MTTYFQSAPDETDRRPSKRRKASRLFGAGQAASPRVAAPLERGSNIFPIPRIKTAWLGERFGLKPQLDVACGEVMDRPGSEFSQAIDQLCVLGTDPAHSGTEKILFVSERDALGLTTIAVNFAQLTAGCADHVLLIEANKRRPVLASLMSPNVSTGLIDLMGTKRIICQLRPGLSVIPLLDDETSEILAQRAHRMIHGINGNFDLVVIDGGTFSRGDNDLTEIAHAVNRVFYLTPKGIELKTDRRSSEERR